MCPAGRLRAMLVPRQFGRQHKKTGAKCKEEETTANEFDLSVKSQHTRL